MSIAAPGVRPSLAASVAVQLRVIRALIIREAQADYSVETLGFFWIIAEPLILTVGVIVLWTISNHGESHSGQVNIPMLAATGYTHIQLWRYCVLRNINGIRPAGWLLYHRNVKILDYMIARGVSLYISILASFVLVVAVGVLFGVMPMIRDPALVVAGFTLDAWFIIPFAIVVCALSSLHEYVEKVVHPLMYLTLILTGSFGLASWYPPTIRTILVWSPLSNCIEMMRAGAYSLSVKTYYDPVYVLLFGLAMWAIGIPLLEYARKKVVIG